MKSNKIFPVLNIFTISICLTLMGCTIAAPAPTSPKETISVLNTSRATLTTPTSLPATSTLTITPSITPSPTVSPTETPTLEPTATETPYAIQTPQGENPTDKVLWLLETNNGCQLPCWWGIVPGETTWEEAEQFFNTFVPEIQAASNPQATNYTPFIPLSPEVFQTGNAYASNAHPIYTVIDGIVEDIITDVSIGDTPLGYLTPYLLPRFLTTYGEPTEVWLFTYASAFEEGDLPFVVALYYADQRIAALYSDNGVAQGDVVHGCPQQNPVSILELWSSSLNLTFEQITNASAFNRDFRPLAETTGMDVATFYETFKNADNTACLETPRGNWYR